MREGSRRTHVPQLNADAALEALLALLVVGSALALGALHVPTGLCVTLVAGSGAALALRGWNCRAMPLPALVALGLAAFTALQTLPLPVAWLRVLSPRAADVWLQATTSIGRPANFAPISYDPGASAVEVAHWFSYACVFIAGASVGRRRGSRWAAHLLFASALLIAVITFLHGLFEATRVYGFYTPTFGPSRWHIGPLLNPNTLAGYLNLGAFSGLGLALSRRVVAPRWLLGSGVALLFAISVLSGSRGGVLALPVGLGLTIWMHRRVRLSESGSSRLKGTEWLVLLAPVAGGVALAALGSTSMTWRELMQRNVDKIQIIGWARPMLRDHLWWGIGRGSFESVFQQYRTGTDNLIYSHPENLLVQWVAEWGLAVGGAGLLLMGYGLRGKNLNVKVQSAATGVGVGALLLVLQNVVDLSLEVPAVSLALAAGLGVCWGSVKRASPIDGGRQKWLTPLCLVLTALITLHAGARGLHPVAHNRLAVHEQLQELSLQDPSAVRALRATLDDAMLRHPAEPYFPRLRAVLALQLADEPVLKWLDLALTLSPWSGRTHLVLARALARAGPPHQALLELRLAAQFDPGLAVDTGRMAATVTKAPAALLRAAPEGPVGARVLLAAAERLTEPDEQPARLRLLEVAVEHDPSYLPARLTLIEQLLAAEPCNEAECQDRLERQLLGLERAAPGSSSALEFRARTLAKRGQTDRAEANLAEGCRKFKERSRCLRLRLTLAESLADQNRVLDAAKALVEEACQVDQCLQALMSAGRATESKGALGPALAYFERAAADQPSAATLGAVARVAKALGLYSRADVALTRAAHMKGADPGARKALEEERRRSWLRQLQQPADAKVNPSSAPRN